MEVTNAKIEQYCESHSDLPSKDCEKIYKYTQENVPMAMMLTGPMVGSFIGFLMRSVKAERVLEIGTFTGYSALFMAEQIPENGKVITLDINPETSAIAKKFWAEAKHGKKIEQILAPALETLKSLKGPFDFILIDADKENYPHYFDRALELLAPGGMIALDNSLRNGKVLDATSNMDAGTKAIAELNHRIASRKDLKSFLAPIRDGLMLVLRH